MDDNEILPHLLWNNTTDTSDINTTVFSDSDSKDRLLEIRNTVWFFTYPILITAGTFGNSLVFVVMRRASLKHVSTCFYMSILALADTGTTFYVTIN